jgi:hypothetical protein
MDGDDAGQTAAEIIAPQLSRHWWTRIVALPEGAQPDTVENGLLAQLLGRSQRE